MSQGLRTLAATRLAEVQRGNAFLPFSSADIADARDRAFANRLVTLTLRRAAAWFVEHGYVEAPPNELGERGD